MEHLDFINSLDNKTKIEKNGSLFFCYYELKQHFYKLPIEVQRYFVEHFKQELEYNERFEK